MTQFPAYVALPSMCETTYLKVINYWSWISIVIAEH